MNGRLRPLNIQHGGTLCGMASPNSNRHLLRRPRQRGSPTTSETRELDVEQTQFALSVEGTVPIEFAFSAIPDTVLEPLFRARYHSLLILKDAKILLCAHLASLHCLT